MINESVICSSKWHAFTFVIFEPGLEYFLLVFVDRKNRQIKRRSGEDLSVIISVILDLLEVCII